MNANTNSHSRAIIHRAKASNTTLAHRFGVSTKTIAKWKNLSFKKEGRPKKGNALFFFGSQGLQLN
jgi:transposase